MKFSKNFFPSSLLYLQTLRTFSVLILCQSMKEANLSGTNSQAPPHAAKAKDRNTGTPTLGNKWFAAMKFFRSQNFSQSTNSKSHQHPDNDCFGWRKIKFPNHQATKPESNFAFAAVLKKFTGSITCGCEPMTRSAPASAA